MRLVGPPQPPGEEAHPGMQVHAHQQRAQHCRKLIREQCLDRMGMLRRKANGAFILVVLLVEALVQELRV